MFLTIGQSERLHVELVAGTHTRFSEQLVHGHDQITLGNTTHSVQYLLNSNIRKCFTKYTKSSNVCLE